MCLANGIIVRLKTTLQNRDYSLRDYSVKCVTHKREYLGNVNIIDTLTLKRHSLVLKNLKGQRLQLALCQARAIQHIDGTDPASPSLGKLEPGGAAVRKGLSVELGRDGEEPKTLQMGGGTKASTLGDCAGSYEGRGVPHPLAPYPRAQKRSKCSTSNVAPLQAPKLGRSPQGLSSPHMDS